MDNQRIAHCVELLCQEGCSDVRSTILRLEGGESIPQLDGLSPGEQRAVLEELKTIMAVYDRR